MDDGDQPQIADFPVQRAVFGVVQGEVLEGRVKFDPFYSQLRYLIQQLQTVWAVGMDGGEGQQPAALYRLGELIGVPDGVRRVATGSTTLRSTPALAI